MAFVSPSTALPCIVVQIESDIDIPSLAALSDFDLNVFHTADGVAFVDGIKSLSYSKSQY